MKKDFSLSQNFARKRNLFVPYHLFSAKSSTIILKTCKPRLESHSKRENMLKREAYQQLLDWKYSPSRKPLLLRGARHTGKTTLLKEFGEKEFSDVVYLNFEEDPLLDSIFTGKLSADYLLRFIGILLEKPIEDDSLIIFDEVQNSPKALHALKYFEKERPDIPIVAAGSLLGVYLSQDSSFPIRKVDLLTLYPLSFLEFLDVIGEDKLRKVLKENGQRTLPEFFHERLIILLKEYFLVGGMPKAVSTYIQTRDFGLVRKVQQEILQSYALDFTKETSSSDAKRIAKVWKNIPKQLSQKRKIFSYAKIHKNARAREYEPAIQWLIDAGLVLPCYQSYEPSFFLSLSGKISKKLFLLDVGLLTAIFAVPALSLFEEDALFYSREAAFLENFTAQALFPQALLLHYWSSQNQAEVDFLIAGHGEIFPLEVSSEVNKKKKALDVYKSKYAPQHLLRSTPNNFQTDGKVENIPLYAIELIQRFFVD